MRPNCERGDETPDASGFVNGLSGGRLCKSEGHPIELRRISRQSEGGTNVKLEKRRGHNEKEANPKKG